MLNFLSAKLIKKIILSLVLIMFMAVGIASPITARADAWATFFNITSGVGTMGAAPAINALWNNLTGNQGTVGEKVSGAIGDKLKKATGNFAEQAFMAVVYAITWLANLVLGTLSSLFTMLLAWIMDASTSGALSYTHISGSDANPAVAIGWPIVRDLSNMIIVLGFVIIGIATALRIREYEAKKLLGKLIIIALLINFSLLFCGIFIDAANITSSSFLKSTQFFTKTWAQSVWGAGDQFGLGFDKLDPEKTSSFVAKCVALIFQNIVLIIVSGAYFFLFLFRYMALWILVILSPLAFVCWVFPFTQKIWNMWWSNFFQWCIIIVPAAFFMWLADKINKEMVTTMLVPSAGAGAGEEGAKMFLGMLVFLIPGFFMLIGLFISIQIAPMGASAAIGLASAAGGYALGAAGKGAGALANKTGLSRVGDRISNSAGQLAERWGLRAEGTTASNAAKNAKAAQERTSNLSFERQAQLAGKQGIGSLSYGAAQDKVAAIQNLAKEGKLHLISNDIGKQAAALQYAHSDMTSRGTDTSDLWKNATKSDPRLAGYDPGMIKKHGSSAKAVENAYAKANVGDIRNFSADALKDPAFVKHTSANKIGRAALEMSSTQIRAIKSQLPNIITEGQRLRGIMNANTPGTPIHEAAKTKRDDYAKKYSEVKSL